MYRFVNILHNLQGYITNSVGKSQAVYDYLRGKLKKVFYPYKSMVIDESLIFATREYFFLSIYSLKKPQVCTEAGLYLWL